jgi:hypothetical protein
MYESIGFHRYRKRHIELHEQLENTEGVENRSPLVREAGELLNDLKAHCSSKRMQSDAAKPGR